MATYQTGPCDSSKSISRYFNTANTYRRFGIQYCSTDEYQDFNTSSALYAGSLPADAGSSLNVKVFRNTTESLQKLARLEVTYYVTYKGNKGKSSLTVI